MWRRGYYRHCGLVAGGLLPGAARAAAYASADRVARVRLLLPVENLRVEERHARILHQLLGRPVRRRPVLLLNVDSMPYCV